MRRTASEILSDLEIRIARLEEQPYRTASETEADLSSVKRFLRESIYSPRELDIEELAEESSVLSKGNYHLVPLREAKKKLSVGSGEVFEDKSGREFVLAYNEDTPIFGGKSLIKGEGLLSPKGREIVSVMREMRVQVREEDPSIARELVGEGLRRLLVGGGLLNRRASFSYLDRDMDDYTFIPPYEIKDEIRTWLRMGLREDLIEEKLMRKFKVKRKRAQRMLTEYQRNKLASQRRFR